MNYADDLIRKWTGNYYKNTQSPGPASASTRQFYSTHKGYDYATPVGTQIKAPITGNVVYAGLDNTGWGNRIGVYNPQTDKTTFLSHLSKINVKPGQKINYGDILGFTGGQRGAYGSGNTTGPHLDITEEAGRILDKAKKTYSNVQRTPVRYGNNYQMQLVKNLFDYIFKGK
jgi:hypothetical protein